MSEPMLIFLLEIALVMLASWTLAYEFALAVQLASGLTFIPFLICAFALAALLWRGWRRMLRGWSTRVRRYAAVGVLSLVAAAITLVTSQPNNDDLSFYHRAHFQLLHLDQPFLLTDTALDVPRLPALSALHVRTSYEPGVAMAAKALDIEPVWFYQNVTAALAAALLPLVYFQLYRHFGVRRIGAWGATAGVLIFLVLDGDLIRSFGSVALVRLWQGKAILWTLVLPLTLLMAVRYLRRPTGHRWTTVALAAICSPGLSNSGVFLTPVLLFAISLAYLLGYGKSRTRIGRAIKLNLASFYCLLLAAAVLIGIIPKPQDMSAWVAGWPSTWLENLNLVMGGRLSWARNLLLLIGLPWFVLRRPLARFPVLLTLSLLAIFANPVSGPIWMRAIQPASYWRLAYLFPVPWCAGLAIAALLKPWRSKKTWMGVCVAAGAMCVSWAAYRAPAVMPGPGDWFKAVGEYKVRRPDYEFARVAGPLLEGRRLLASEDMVVVLALLEPDLRLVSGRTGEVVHTFVNAGQPAEGLRRAAAQTLVDTGVRTAERDAALATVLDQGVDAVIVRTAVEPVVAPFLMQASGNWTAVERDANYVLWLRRN